MLQQIELEQAKNGGLHEREEQQQKTSIKSEKGDNNGVEIEGFCGIVWPVMFVK